MDGFLFAGIKFDFLYADSCMYVKYQSLNSEYIYHYLKFFTVITSQALSFSHSFLQIPREKRGNRSKIRCTWWNNPNLLISGRIMLYGRMGSNGVDQNTSCVTNL